jgi:hypothetical protein
MQSATRPKDRRKLTVNEIFRELRDQGFEVTPGATGNSYQAKAPNGQGIVHFHSTSVARDHNRAYDNLIHQLMRVGFTHPSDKERAVAEETAPTGTVVNTKGFVKVRLSQPIFETYNALVDHPDGLSNDELSNLTGFPVSTLRNHHTALRLLGLVENAASGVGKGSPGTYRALGPAIAIERGSAHGAGGTLGWRVDGTTFSPSRDVYPSTTKRKAAPKETATNGHTAKTAVKKTRPRSGPVRARKLPDETPAGRINAALKVLERTTKEQNEALATIAENLGALVTEDADNRKKLRTIEEKLDNLVGAL